MPGIFATPRLAGLAVVVTLAASCGSSTSDTVDIHLGCSGQTTSIASSANSPSAATPIPTAVAAAQTQPPAPTPTPRPSTGSATPIPAAPLSPLASEAGREASSLRSSTYTHDVAVDEKAGSFNFDCSGFVAYLLSKVSPAALAQVSTFSHISPAVTAIATVGTGARPTAGDFEAFFAHLGAGTDGLFTGVVRESQIQAGDFIAWTNPPGTNGDDTGYVAVMTGKPLTPAANSPSEGDVTCGPAPDGMMEAVVSVVDSTQTLHGSDDSRVADPRVTNKGGLGHAQLVLLMRDDVVIGYRWSQADCTFEFPPGIAVGHLAG